MTARSDGNHGGYPRENGDLFHENTEADAKASAFLLNPTFEIERDLLDRGYRVIAGIDEAGRGALAGPLSVGFVVYAPELISAGPGRDLLGIRDSKKLTPKLRDLFFPRIYENSLVSETLFASHRLVDELNVNGATEYLIRKFLARGGTRPDILIIDGNFSFNLGIPSLSVRKGDSRSITIASASVLAKVKRDRVMDRLDARFPGYDFSVNRGYGTGDHMEAIRRRGFSRIHRKSYEPVKSMIEPQGELFS